MDEHLLDDTRESRLNIKKGKTHDVTSTPGCFYAVNDLVQGAYSGVIGSAPKLCDWKHV